jgi:hypothetical protein
MPKEGHPEPSAVGQTYVAYLSRHETPRHFSAFDKPARYYFGHLPEKLDKGVLRRLRGSV